MDNYDCKKNEKHVKDALGHLRHVDLKMLLVRSGVLCEQHVCLAKRHLEMWEIQRKEPLPCKTSEPEKCAI
jgi:hypothetical protein